MSDSVETLLARVDERGESMRQEIVALRSELKTTGDRHERLILAFSSSMERAIDREAEDRRMGDRHEKGNRLKVEEYLDARITELEKGPMARGFASVPPAMSIENTTPIALPTGPHPSTDEESKARTRLYYAGAALLGAATTALTMWAAGAL